MSDSDFAATETAPYFVINHILKTAYDSPGRLAKQRVAPCPFENGSGEQFTGTWSQWGSVGSNMGKEMLGVHAMAEGIAGADMTTEELLEAEERIVRFAAGASACAGSVAGAAAAARNAVGVQFTRLPGSRFVELCHKRIVGPLTRPMSSALQSVSRGVMQKTGLAGVIKSQLVQAVKSLLKTDLSPVSRSLASRVLPAKAVAAMETGATTTLRFLGNDLRPVAKRVRDRIKTNECPRILPESSTRGVVAQGKKPKPSQPDFIGPLSQEQQYARVVSSNKIWSWAEDFPGGADLTAAQRKAIRLNAIDQGLIPDVPFKLGTKFPDFEAAGLVHKVESLPEWLWKASDMAQFDWLDARLPGGRPAGTTWHHSDIPGRMELVDFGPHNTINHKGGRSPGMWASLPR